MAAGGLQCSGQNEQRNQSKFPVVNGDIVTGKAPHFTSKVRGFEAGKRGS